MPLYIKDSSVDELAEQVRKRLGARTKTDAVRVALQHELQRVKTETPMRERLAAARRLAREELGPPVPDIDIKQVMDEIWEDGA